MTDAVQRPDGWCSVSMVCQFRALCPEVLGLASRCWRVLSRPGRHAYMCLGWLTVFAWIINCAGPPAIISNIITALAAFNYATYQPKAWHTTLIMWGLILVPFVFNLWFRQLLNTFELLGGLLHIIFFIASIITLAVLAQRSTPDFVFNTLTTGQSGWTNAGVSWGLGLLTVTFAVSGAE